MPVRRSAIARMVVASSASGTVRASTTTKSLPMPCILLKRWVTAETVRSGLGRRGVGAHRRGGCRCGRGGGRRLRPGWQHQRALVAAAGECGTGKGNDQHHGKQAAHGGFLVYRRRV